ncbi:TetR/AcrR family transcriptional regulator [Jidongwangia harbinensis]|uniref:TetR/AcrR family transcriptional regulator n=1 Tax=Jidongwangia harbinensis TaxID=2878561 RepID=UPI001CDA3003|nr:TetR/AcrR family transcriptional regulator [Jidongwangia harbinensis]MCA2214330.1 TetR/AcrR family transcriptional regulator [Jidongwangia harbinensis]
MARSKTRDEILSVAARQFAAAGFKGTSLQTIADEVGCSKATVLYHFDSKDAILVALIAPAGQDLAALTARLSTLDADAARDAAIEGFAELVVRYRGEVALIFDQMLSIFDLPAFEPLWPDFETLHHAFAGWSSDPDELLLAEVMLAGISSVVLNHPDDELPTLRDAVARVARRALTSR